MGPAGSVPAKVEMVPSLSGKFFAGMCTRLLMSEREKEGDGRVGWRWGDEGRQESSGARPAKLEECVWGGGGRYRKGGSVQRQPLGCSCGLTPHGSRGAAGQGWAGSDGEEGWVLCFHCNYN